MPESVRLMHYDPRWPQEFEQIRSNVLHSCEGWITDVAHVGSTAISGLIARPIIDVVATIDDLAGFDEAIERLRGIDFAVASAPDWAGNDATLMVKPRHGQATHHLFLAPAGSELRRRLLAVRDWFRADAEQAVRFEEAKVDRWRESEGDPASYAEAKAAYFARIEEQLF